MITENYKCEYFIYNKLYNLKRHMMTKHKENNSQHLINNKPNTHIYNDNNIQIKLSGEQKQIGSIYRAIFKKTKDFIIR
jgi:hypothetical protein